MAERGRRTRDDGRGGRDAAEGAPAGREGQDATAAALVRFCDPAGRPRGTGFAADHHGTVLTSHEAVDGLSRLVLHAPGDRSCVVTAGAVTPLPDLGLAIVRTEGLALAPLPVIVRDRVGVGSYVRLVAGGWREARVLGTTAVTYTATDRCHLLDGAMELAIGTAGVDALRLGGGAAGGPVLDAETGAVVAVLGTALHTEHRAAGFAVPLRGTGCAAGPLDELLARNAATVPAYRADLNPAGVLELAATTVGSDGPSRAHEALAPVERARIVGEFAAFADGPAAVLGLVGAPGSGRTTELASLAARRTRAPEPAPTLWLRGADLLATDTSVADAAARALERAARIVAAADGVGGVDGGARHADGVLGDVRPERLARVAREAGRPLLLLLDGPEEMPSALAHRLPEWTAGTAAWLREAEARLVVACRAEYWEQAGAGFPRELLHGAEGQVAYGGGRLPPCVWLGDLGDEEARRVRLRYGIPEGALADADARHPLTLRLLAEVRAAGAGAAAPGRETVGGGTAGGGSGDSEGCGGSRGARDARGSGDSRASGGSGDSRGSGGSGDLGGTDGSGAWFGRLGRDEVFSSYLDLMCLRIAVRLAAADGLRGTAVRRLAARVSGQVHAAARRCLGAGQGELDRESFEAVFPWGPVPGRPFDGITGWATAVLTEGLLVPAGNGYRFAHEELADWIQGMHLDLEAALHALVHRDRDTPPSTPPVPRHRTGPIVQALLLLARQQGPAELALRLEDLADAAGALLPQRPDPGAGNAQSLAAPTAATRPPATRPPATRTLAARTPVPTNPGPLGPTLLHPTSSHPTPSHPTPSDHPAWWPVRLLADVLLHVPDATPYLPVLRHLAARIIEWRAQGRCVPEEFGPSFWESVPVGDTERFDLLRQLVVADEAPGGPAEGPRYLDAVSGLLAADPTAVHPHLTRWFDDDRPLPATPDATVATAAQALLHTHRRRALDDLTEALADSAHRRGDELLAVLAEEEPSAVCRAVDRWAHDERPARRVAAVAYGLRAAPHVRTEDGRELLRYAALALLARPADCTLHGGALALLVRDPRTRSRHLPQALARFGEGDPQVPASALATALASHPEPVLEAFQARLRRPGPDVGEVLRTLADVTTPALARRVATLVREVVELRPETADHVAAYVERRLEQGLASRAVLLPLVGGLLDGGPPEVRVALTTVLAAPGGAESGPLRHELLGLLLGRERDPAVLVALLCAAADGARHSGEQHTRELVRRAGLLLVRTPDGATRFDQALVELGRRVPGFAPLVARWLTREPEAWAAVVGPSTRRMIENLAGVVRVPA
ncbi:trypsin-like peptidase domain-containing protein [Streptomyces avermitilis]|uniref:trypsin-like peptidase domain-containing protein n=1 Tax=Streptomyces avermitilis TaxID=33903 RepID=UPI003818DB1C